MCILYRMFLAFFCAASATIDCEPGTTSGCHFQIYFELPIFNRQASPLGSSLATGRFQEAILADALQRVIVPNMT